MPNLIHNEDFRLWVLMRQTTEAIRKLRARELGKYGISPVHAAILYILKTSDEPVTPALISRWLIREPHGVSEMLDRMEKIGLVSKVKDLDRKNRVRIVITDKGEEVYQIASEMKSIRKVMSRLSYKQRGKLSLHIRLLRGKAFKELGDERKFPFP